MENPENFKLAQREQRKILPAFQELRDHFHQLAEDYFDEKIDKDTYFGKQKVVLNDFVENFKEVLVHAFQSESESWYFMGKDDSCLRIKKDNHRGIYLEQPVMEKLYFVDPSDYGKVSRSLAVIESKDACIPIVDLKVGVIPIELSLVESAMLSGGRYQIIEENSPEGKLVKIILDRSDDSIVVPCPYHLGHPVKIISY
jgi:hypothetical protein